MRRADGNADEVVRASERAEVFAAERDLPVRGRRLVIGLGRAFTLMLPTFDADPRIKLTAASDPQTLL